MGLIWLPDPNRWPRDPVPAVAGECIGSCWQAMCSEAGACRSSREIKLAPQLLVCCQISANSSTARYDRGSHVCRSDILYSVVSRIRSTRYRANRVSSVLLRPPTTRMWRFCRCMSVSKKKIVEEFWRIFGGMGCVTSNSWLDFGGDPDRDADTGIFKWNYYHYRR